MFQLQLFFLLHCDESDRVVALPRHKFVTGATLLATIYHCLPEIALSLVIYPFPAILFSWGAPSIEGHSAFIQACDWLYIEAALTFFFSFFSILFFFFLFLRKFERGVFYRCIYFCLVINTSQQLIFCRRDGI
jgi:hypothetical protein